MKRMFLVLLIVLVTALPVFPQTSVNPCGIPRLVARAFETITVSTTSIGLTQATMQNMVAAKVTIETASIYYREDGTDPTATVGHRADAGEVLWVCGASLGPFRMIRIGSDSTARVTVYMSN